MFCEGGVVVVGGRFCARCGRSLRGKRAGALYCSVKCKDVAAKRRKRERQKDGEGGVRVCDQRDHVLVVPLGQSGVTRAQFDRMMDTRTVDELRFIKTVLHRALSEPDTSESALPALARELARASRLLDELEEAPPAGGLFDSVSESEGAVFDVSDL